MEDTRTKYIDADRLNAEIERHIKEIKDAAKRLTPNMGFFDAKLSGIYDVMSIVASLQQEQPELPPIGYADTYYQKGLHDGFIKGQMEILKVLDEIEKRKAEPVLVIKEQEQQEVDLEKEIDRFWDSCIKHKNERGSNVIWCNKIEIEALFRYVFELGLKSK